MLKISKRPPKLGTLNGKNGDPRTLKDWLRQEKAELSQKVEQMSSFQVPIKCSPGLCDWLDPRKMFQKEMLFSTGGLTAREPPFAGGRAILVRWSWHVHVPGADLCAGQNQGQRKRHQKQLWVRRPLSWGAECGNGHLEASQTSYGPKRTYYGKNQSWQLCLTTSDPKKACLWAQNRPSKDESLLPTFVIPADEAWIQRSLPLERRGLMFLTVGGGGGGVVFFFCCCGWLGGCGCFGFDCSCFCLLLLLLLSLLLLLLLLVACSFLLLFIFCCRWLNEW